MRVLLVEDDPLIASGVIAGLRKHGIEVHNARTAKEGELAHTEEAFHAAVLDLGLPDRDGIDLLPRLRSIAPQLPVLILTARDSIEHKLKGLHAGADDYMVKPFDLRELAARLHVLVRRSQDRSSHLVMAGPLRLDPEGGLAWLNGTAITLSRREIDLLTQLASINGRWISPTMLNEKIYGLTETVSSNALNVHIHNIRRKLGPDSIETARGLGFRLGWRTPL